MDVDKMSTYDLMLLLGYLGILKCGKVLKSGIKIVKNSINK